MPKCVLPQYQTQISYGHISSETSHSQGSLETYPLPSSRRTDCLYHLSQIKSPCKFSLFIQSIFHFSVCHLIQEYHGGKPVSVQSQFRAIQSDYVTFETGTEALLLVRESVFLCQSFLPPTTPQKVGGCRFTREVIAKFTLSLCLAFLGNLDLRSKQLLNG